MRCCGCNCLLTEKELLYLSEEDFINNSGLCLNCKSYSLNDYIDENEEFKAEIDWWDNSLQDGLDDI